MEKHITVVGAGPSGLTASLVLAKNGYTVDVYERHADVGHRFHGDFQGLENWTTKADILDILQNMGININFQAHPFSTFDVYDAKLHKTTIRSDQPLFYLVKRGPGEHSIDQGLKQQAEEVGVRFHFRLPLQKVEPPAVISTGPRAAEAIAVGLLFETDLEDMAVAIVDDNVAPKGYAYLLVLNGKATLATVLFRWFRKEREYLDRTVKTFERLFTLKMNHVREFGGFGNWYLKPNPGEHMKLYTGEAAGLQDSLFGFGMRYAILSGYFAAQSILNGASYSSFIKEHLHPTVRASLVNRFLYERFGNRGYSYWIRYCGRVKNPRDFFRKRYAPSLWKSLLFPVAYAYSSYRRRYRDESCSHEDCTCVWCRCQKTIQPVQ